MPHYEQDYMSSYIIGGEYPIGTMAAVWWFKPDDIEPLVQIENEQQIRVFPRYVHKITWYERYDAFCWKYKLNEEYWAGKIKIHNEETNKLRELAYKEGLNLDRLYEDNPGIIKAGHFQLILEEVQKDPANDIEVALDFLNLLLNFNPAPWDFASSSRDYYESLWKSITPFKNDSVPDCVEELKPEEYKPSMSDAEVDEIICEIQPLVRKGYVQDWAADNHQKFIEEYTSLARRSDFSYGYVWDLKCRYLIQLYAFLNKKIIEEAKYAFFAEGQTWTITYNEKTIRGLRGKGFKILHYLVSNQNKSFFPEELDLLDGVALEHMSEDPGIKRSSNSVKASTDLSKLSKPKTHHLNKIHGKSENELRREYNKKKAALEKAKHDGDPLIIEEAQKNLDEIKEYSLEYFGIAFRTEKLVNGKLALLKIARK